MKSVLLTLLIRPGEKGMYNYSAVIVCECKHVQAHICSLWEQGFRFYLEANSGKIFELKRNLSKV